ncbi:MAG: EamA family transporter [Alphaproteobacteria bacterium]|nr:EamA family transporter [Alphaproteobacteria bacterium]MBV8411428.1 EamA family transporter [Alphaproteobacteria bacterium]
MPLWIPITIAAALFQNIRTTMQQKIRGVLSVDGANYVRYLYGAPLALGGLAVLVIGTGRSVPALSASFFVLVAIAGVAQIVATSLMIHSFSLRNYAVGTVYSKTETVFVALFATFVAHEPLNLGAWFGIVVCLFGVAILTLRGSLANLGTVLAHLTHKGAIYGLLSGAIFALAAGNIREASKLLPDGDFIIRGITVLACMNTIQVVLMAAYLSRRDRPQLSKVWINWRSSIWVGIFSVLGSAGWALAMTLENAALVRAVGQIELVFTFIASHVVLKERPTSGEWFGSLLVVGGVVLILIVR